jgi:predicted RNase H-like HicB family nuclease
MLRLDFQLRAPFQVNKESESNLYVAECPPLDVASQGETRDEAIANLVEALTLFLETAFETGTLHQVLLDCGLEPVATSAPQPVDESDYLNVPLHLVARQHAENHAHQE